MIVIVDERETVLNGYTSWFYREGVSATGLAPGDFRQWVNTAPEPDIGAVEAFLLGDFQNREEVPGKIKSRSDAAVIAMNDTKSLNDTLELFAAGVDDVVRKPVHVREILARIKAISRRAHPDAQPAVAGGSEFSPTGAIPRSTASLCRCRGASAGSSNISPRTRGGALPRRKSSTSFTACSTTASTRT